MRKLSSKRKEYINDIKKDDTLTERNKSDLVRIFSNQNFNDDQIDSLYKFITDPNVIFKDMECN